MILEEDSLLKFNYDPATDILSVCYPDMIGTPLAEIENSMQKLARNIKNFDVRKLLVDLRSGLPGVEDEAYKKLVEQYLIKLSETNLEKVARLIPENPAREYFILQFSREMQEKLDLPFEVRFFTKNAEALEWLLEPEY